MSLRSFSVKASLYLWAPLVFVMANSVQHVESGVVMAVSLHRRRLLHRCRPSGFKTGHDICMVRWRNLVDHTARATSGRVSFDATFPLGGRYT